MFSCDVFILVWYEDNAGLSEWFRKCSLCYFLEKFVWNQYHFFLKKLREYSSLNHLVLMLSFWKGISYWWNCLNKHGPTQVIYFSLSDFWYILSFKKSVHFHLLFLLQYNLLFVCLCFYLCFCFAQYYSLVSNTVSGIYLFIICLYTYLAYSINSHRGVKKKKPNSNGSIT